MSKLTFEERNQFQLSAFVGGVLPVRFVKHPGRPAYDRSAYDEGALGLGIPEGLGAFRADMDFSHPEKNSNRRRKGPESRESPSSTSTESKVCLTPSCVKAAARMLDNMDDEVTQPFFLLD